MVVVVGGINLNYVVLQGCHNRDINQCSMAKWFAVSGPQMCHGTMTNGMHCPKTDGVP